MGRINYFDIQLQQTQNGMFYGGQLMQGALIIDVVEPISVRAAYILITGDSRTFWVNKTSDKIYEGHDSHINARLDLNLGPSSHDGQTLQQGTHSLPFGYSLPESLPSSFEGEYGNTRYVATARIDLFSPSRFMGSGAVAEYQVDKVFMVCPMINPSARSLQAQVEPVRSIETIEMVGCLGKSGIVEIELAIAKPEFRVGEQLSATVSMRNSSKSKIKNIEFLLFQHTRFQAISRYESVADYKDMSRVVDTVHLGQLGSGKQQQWPVAILVPQVPPSQTGRIIGIAYWVKVLSKDGIEVTVPVGLTT